MSCLCGHGESCDACSSTTKPKTSSEEHYKWMLRRRNVRDVCDRCKGTGGLWYGSTATWRGGVGGASMTYDVCDNCWGSGDEVEHWTNLRQLRDEEDARIADRVARNFEESTGAFMNVMRPGIEALCEELDKFERQRRPRPEGFHTASRCLAKWLRKIVAAKKTEASPEP